MDSDYSLKEETTFRTELFRRLSSQDLVLGDIRDEAKKHNGRMTKIEVRIEDYEENKKIIAGLKAREMWIMGGIAVIMVGGSFVWNLVLKDILNTAEDNMRKLIKEQQEEIASKVVSSIEQKYDLEIVD